MEEYCLRQLCDLKVETTEFPSMGPFRTELPGRRNENLVSRQNQIVPGASTRMPGPHSHPGGLNRE